jgi:hypothetical protein
MDDFLQVEPSYGLFCIFSRLRGFRMAWATIAGKGGHRHRLPASRSR